MLITIAPSELDKFPAPTYDYTNPDNPALISAPPYAFELLAQHPETYQCCGVVSGDLNAFTASKIIHQEVAEIPAGYVQRCLPGSYGDTLSYMDILKIRLQQTDYQVIKAVEYAQAGLPAPYDITTLHQTRETLREQIRALEPPQVVPDILVPVEQ